MKLREIGSPGGLDKIWPISGSLTKTLGPSPTHGSVLDISIPDY